MMRKCRAIGVVGLSLGKQCTAQNPARYYQKRSVHFTPHKFSRKIRRSPLSLIESHPRQKLTPARLLPAIVQDGRAERVVRCTTE